MLREQIGMVRIIIFNPVNDIFIYAHLIGKSAECQVMFFCKCENFFVVFWHSVQVTLVESSQISASGRHMQALLVCEQGYLYEQFGIIIEITVKKAGNRNHRAIGSVLFFLLR